MLAKYEQYYFAPTLYWWPLLQGLRLHKSLTVLTAVWVTVQQSRPKILGGEKERKRKRKREREREKESEYRDNAG